MIVINGLKRLPRNQMFISQNSHVGLEVTRIFSNYDSERKSGVPHLLKALDNCLDYLGFKK